MVLLLSTIRSCVDGNFTLPTDLQNWMSKYTAAVRYA